MASNTRILRIEFGPKVLPTIFVAGFWLTLILGVVFGSKEVVDPLMSLAESVLEKLAPSIDALVVGGGIAGAAGYGLKRMNSK